MITKCTTVLSILAVLTFAGCAGAKKKTDASSTAAPSSTSTSAVAAPASDAMKVSCKKGSDARVLEIVKKGPGCELNYTKGGKTDVPSSSSVSTKHCQDIQKRIRGKLEHAGYVCS